MFDVYAGAVVIVLSISKRRRENFARKGTSSNGVWICVATATMWRVPAAAVPDTNSCSRKGSLADGAETSWWNDDRVWWRTKLLPRFEIGQKMQRTTKNNNSRNNNQTKNQENQERTMFSNNNNKEISHQREGASLFQRVLVLQCCLLTWHLAGVWLHGLMNCRPTQFCISQFLNPLKHICRELKIIRNWRLL